MTILNSVGDLQEYFGKMKETYYLNQETLPQMPVPHDNQIKRITVDKEFITFFLTAKDYPDDGIRVYHPEAKALTMRFHLTYEDDFFLVKQQTRRLAHLIPHFLLPATFTWRSRYISMRNKKLNGLADSGEYLDYIAHYVDYEQIIIQFGFYSLKASVDYVEYEWIS